MTWHHTRTVADGPGRSPVVKRGRPVAIDQGAVSEQGGWEWVPRCEERNWADDIEQCKGRALTGPSETLWLKTATALACLFRTARTWPLLSIGLIVLIQHVFVLDLRHLWWADEVRHGGVLLDLQALGHGWALSLNGAPYPDKPPLYFWLLAAASALADSNAAWVFFAVLALTVLMTCLATWHLAMRLLKDPTIALISVIILVTGSYFIALSHYVRMDFMFTALIVLAWAAFYKAIATVTLDRTAVIAGFGLAALACLTKGPVGALLPLSAFAVDLLVRGKAGLLLDRAVLAGAALLFGILGVWAAGVFYFGGVDYLLHQVNSQIVQRAIGGGQSWPSYLRYAVTFPLTLLPWGLVFLFKAGKRDEGLAQPIRFLTTTVVTGLALLSVIGEKHEYYLLPLLVPVAILCGERLTRLDPARCQGFASMLAIYTAAIGLILLTLWQFGPFFLKDSPHILPTAAGLIWPGVVALALAAGIFALHRATLQAVMMGVLMGQSAFSTVLIEQVFPALDQVLSPSRLLSLMQPALAAGYDPAFVHGIKGVFAHDLGRHYGDLDGLYQLEPWLKDKACVVLALQWGEWQQMSSHTAGFQILGCVGFLGQTHVVVARPAGLEVAEQEHGVACVPK